MYKYEMIIDGSEYSALFADHFEAADFLDENDRDGAEVIVKGYHEMTAEEILADEDFEWSYRVEMASTLTIPNHKDFSKWSELETELKRLGYIA